MLPRSGVFAVLVWMASASLCTCTRGECLLMDNEWPPYHAENEHAPNKANRDIVECSRAASTPIQTSSFRLPPGKEPHAPVYSAHQEKNLGSVDPNLAVNETAKLKCRPTTSEKESLWFQLLGIKNFDHGISVILLIGKLLIPAAVITFILQIVAFQFWEALLRRNGWDRFLFILETAGTAVALVVVVNVAATRVC